MGDLQVDLLAAESYQLLGDRDGVHCAWYAVGAGVLDDADSA